MLFTRHFILYNIGIALNINEYYGNTIVSFISCFVVYAVYLLILTGSESTQKKKKGKNRICTYNKYIVFSYPIKPFLPSQKSFFNSFSFFRLYFYVKK